MCLVSVCRLPVLCHDYCQRSGSFYESFFQAVRAVPSLPRVRAERVGGGAQEDFVNSTSPVNSSSSSSATLPPQDTAKAYLTQSPHTNFATTSSAHTASDTADLTHTSSTSTLTHTRPTPPPPTSTCNTTAPTTTATAPHTLAWQGPTRTEQDAHGRHKDLNQCLGLGTPRRTLKGQTPQTEA